MDYVLRRYAIEEFPAIADQYEQWKVSRPLTGRRLLDATPAMRNTMVKYVPLLAAGAHVSVAISHEIPHDPAVAAELPNFGIEVVHPDTDEAFDVVMDCAGYCADVASTYGYAELTRSGIYRYEGKAQPVLMVDSGQIKQIENEYGTGDGFIRAMQQLRYGDVAGRSCVVFGGGKVGRGIARELLERQADVAIVDDPGIVRMASVHYVDRFDALAVREAIASAWCVVTATGIVDALAPHAQDLNDSRALIANMGVDDEFGPDLPDDRVLNDKAPLNFILEEPTQLRFLDPTFALSNASALSLIKGEIPPGINSPSNEMETPILAIWRAAQESRLKR